MRNHEGIAELLAQLMHLMDEGVEHVSDESQKYTLVFYARRSPIGVIVEQPTIDWARTKEEVPRSTQFLSLQGECGRRIDEEYPEGGYDRFDSNLEAKLERAYKDGWKLVHVASNTRVTTDPYTYPSFECLLKRDPEDQSPLDFALKVTL